MKRNSSEPVCSPALGWRLSARGYAGRPTRGGRPAKPEIDALHVGHDTSSSDQMGAPPLHNEPNPRGESPAARARDEWPNPLSDWRFRARLRLRNSNTLVRHLPMPGTSDGAAPSHACDRIDRNLPPDGVPLLRPIPPLQSTRDVDGEFTRLIDSLTRRGFLAGAAALGALGALSACSSESSGTEARTSGSTSSSRTRPTASRGTPSASWYSKLEAPSILHYLPSTRSSRPIGIRSLNSCARYPPARLARWDEQRTECRIDTEPRPRSFGRRERLVELLPGQGPARH